MILLSAVLAAVAATPADPVETRAGLELGQVELAVVEHIAGRTASDPGDVEVLHLGLANSLDCPAEAELEVRTDPGERFIGHANVTVVGWYGGVPCDRTRMRSRVRRWITVPVASAAVGPGDAVAFAPARVDASHLSGAPVAADSGPWEARIPLRAGQPVTMQSVRAIPDARSGESVTLIASRGPLTIAASGLLMDDAYVGQSVIVANTATGTVVEGVYLRDGRVEARGPR